MKDTDIKELKSKYESLVEKTNTILNALDIDDSEASNLSLAAQEEILLFLGDIIFVGDLLKKSGKEFNGIDPEFGLHQHLIDENVRLTGVSPNAVIPAAIKGLCRRFELIETILSRAETSVSFILSNRDKQRS